MALIKDLGNKKHNAMLEVFNTLGVDALYMNHYDLGKINLGYEVADWREFLRLDPVCDYIEEEVHALLDTATRNLLRNVGTSKGQVGAAQLLTALNKMQDNTTEKTGPAYIYCYTPLTKEEEQAPNVQKLDTDPFLKE